MSILFVYFLAIALLISEAFSMFLSRNSLLMYQKGVEYVIV